MKFRTTLLLAAILLICNAAIPAQSASPPMDHPGVKQALEIAQSIDAWVLNQQVSLCEIPAPPFGEAERGAAYRDRLEDLGLRRVRIDSVGNVIGEWGRASDEPTVVLSAHLDTVFPPGTDVSVTREGTLLKGPGIVDDCRGLAVVLGAARSVLESNVPALGRIVFVGTVGEEGPGNLRGVRHLFEEELKDEIDYFISVDGAGSSVTYGAVGSHRYEVVFKGPGGHSFGAFGLPNPIHAAGRLIAKISEFQVPVEPKTTFNVGLIQGGTSVNSIPFSASLSIDMRSVDAAVLDWLVGQFHQAVQESLQDENARWAHESNLEVEIKTIGVRPTGKQNPDDLIVQASLNSARTVGIEASLGFASTDANIPISLGIPGVTIDGGGEGSGAHSPAEEIFNTSDSHKGTQWATLLVLTLTGVR